MAPRSITPGKRRPPREPDTKATHQRPLEVIADPEGSVTVGWVGEGVFYARFVGVLSADLGARHAQRLQKALTQVPSLHYFADSSALRTFDLAARSCFARVVLAHRRQFASLVLLAWAGGITASTRSFASAIGDPVVVLTDELEFEKALVRAAPLARQKLDPRTWKQLQPFPRPSR
jgi:hypothetical protein